MSNESKPTPVYNETERTRLADWFVDVRSHRSRPGRTAEDQAAVEANQRAWVMKAPNNIVHSIHTSRAKAIGNAREDFKLAEEKGVPVKRQAIGRG